MGQRDKAEEFRRMHVPGEPVVLINAWDAASARIVELLGFRAVATTSGGVAFLEGFPDGQKVGRDVMFAGIDRICRAVRVPVTADVEAGYGETVQDAAAIARGVIATGAIGLNFEDGSDGPEGLIDMQLQVERIRAIRQVGKDYGVPLVINARCDVFLNDIGAEETRLGVAIERGRRYHAAGADCIFVPGVTDAPTISTLVRELGAPLNVLTNPSAPPVSEMAALGVARISLGSGPMLRALSAFRDEVLQVRETGTIPARPDVLSHGDLNRYFDQS
jgi:2-methylisocitrate lyase-like PEP mutase family enzyme